MVVPVTELKQEKGMQDYIAMNSFWIRLRRETDASGYLLT